MLQFKHFRLSFLLAALTAGFAFSGCEIEDDDDGGLGDGAIEDKDGDVSGDSSKEDAGKEDAATKECSKDDDCKNVQGVDACHVSICKADGKCSAPEAIAVKEGEICCVGDDDPVCNEGVKNTCAVGACTGTGALEGADYKVCVYTAKEDCCQNAEGGLQCADGKVCKKAPAVETKDAEDGEGGEGGETPEVIAASIDPTLDLGEASVCVECNVAADCPDSGINLCRPEKTCVNNQCVYEKADPNCCSIEEANGEACASDEYGCYTNGKKTVTHNVNDTVETGHDVEREITVVTDVTAGLGVCLKKADVTACAAALTSETTCVEASNQDDIAKYARKTGKALKVPTLQVTADTCMLDNENKLVASETLEFVCDLVGDETCKENLCNSSKTKCRLSAKVKCCKKDSDCTGTDECFDDDGIAVTGTNEGWCADPDAVTACRTNCEDKTECDPDDSSKLIVYPACVVNKGEVSDCTPIPTDCSENNQVCGKKIEETGEGPTTVAVETYACIDNTVDPCEGKEQWASCGDPNLFCQTQTEGGMKCGAIACDIDATTINPQCPDNYHCAKEDGAENAYCVADIPVVGSCSTKGEFCASTPVQIDQFCVEDTTEAGAQQAASLKCDVISCTGSESPSPCPDNAVCDGTKCVLKCENSMASHVGYCAGGQTCVSSDEPTPVYGCVTEMPAPGKK